MMMLHSCPLTVTAANDEFVMNNLMKNMCVVVEREIKLVKGLKNIIFTHCRSQELKWANSNTVIRDI